MKQFKKNRIALSVSMLVASSAVGMAYAPVASAQEGTVEEVVVTGIRGSLQRAQAVKMDSKSVVEAISAEDIGKLPDSSIAESLARLPGLAGERRGGRVSGISVRGFKEDFIGVTMNGREVLGIGDNRGVEFDLYPAEIMTGATIFKSAEANLITQGIGGTVNLQTARPLDSDDGYTINGTLEKNGGDEDNPDYDGDGHRWSVSATRKFHEDTVGIALVYASTESPANSRDYNTWGGYNTSGGIAVPFGTPSNARSKVLERDTFSAILQLSPNDDINVVFDWLDINFSENGIYRGLWTDLGSSVTDVNSTDGLTGTGSLPPRTMTLREDPQLLQGDLQAFGMNAEFKVADNVTVVLDVARSETSKNDTGAEAYAGLGRSYGANDSFNLPPDDPNSTQSLYDFTTTMDGTIFTPVANADFSDWNTVKLAGPQRWGGSLAAFADDFTSPGQDPNITFINAQDGFQNSAVFSEELDTARLEVKVDLDGFITQVSAGAAYTERNKIKDNQGFFVTAPTFPGDGLIPEQYRLGLTDLSWTGFGQIVAYDSIGLYEDGFYSKVSAQLIEPDRLGDSFTISEKVSTFYLKGEYDTELAGFNVFGNIGLQYVDTDQSSDGTLGIIQPNFQVDPNNTISGGATYDHWLPSINLNVQVTDSQVLRLAASNTISRARLDQMKASGFVKFDQNADLALLPDPVGPDDRSPWSKFQGSPELRPLESYNYDAAYEWYFTDDGYVSATYFFKDLVNWTREISEIIDFSNDATNDGANYYIPDFHLGGGNPPATLKGFFSHFEDGLTGEVEGWEFTANLPLYVTGVEALDGFGLAGSATFIDASLDDGSKIPGQSDEVYSLTAYWEYKGFEIRFAATKRGDFLTYQRGGSNKIEEAQRSGVELLDAQISYDFAESGIEYLEGLRVSLQGTNLTDEDEESRAGSTGIVTRREQFGPTYLLNLNYGF